MDAMIILTRDDEKRLRVLHAIDRSIDEITVEELCHKSGISRRTFYRLFNSKYDIWLWYSSLGEKNFLDRIGREYSWSEAFVHHFAFLARERERQYWAVGRRQFLRSDTQAKFDSRRQTIMDTICDIGRVPLDATLQFVIDVYVWVEISIVYEWCRSTNPLSPEELTECLLGFVPDVLIEAMTPTT